MQSSGTRSVQSVSPWYASHEALFGPQPTVTVPACALESECTHVIPFGLAASAGTARRTRRIDSKRRIVFDSFRKALDGRRIRFPDQCGVLPPHSATS